MLVLSSQTLCPLTFVLFSLFSSNYLCILWVLNSRFHSLSTLKGGKELLRGYVR
jgi:hypothetical protein